jgi:hypothetical protein
MLAPPSWKSDDSTGFGYTYSTGLWEESNNDPTDTKTAPRLLRGLPGNIF